VWLKATPRGRVQEGAHLPPARSVKLKLPPFYKVNGKPIRGPLPTCKKHCIIATGSVLKRFYACTCSYCVALSMEKKTFLFRSIRRPPCPPCHSTGNAGHDSFNYFTKSIDVATGKYPGALHLQRDGMQLLCVIATTASLQLGHI
jgi:hypothetical protein